ncbi:MAG: DUF2891 domain-containing protein [Phycisphaerales bacterium]|nr:DUF2891 domain-containing protein [Phycisphaerales bacterium]
MTAHHASGIRASDALLDRVATMALSGIGREYPNQIAHAMAGPGDIGSPRALHPAFFGCYDWHSAVHTHWTLVRLIRRRPGAPWAGVAASTLEHSLSPHHLAGELEYLRPAWRATFERPYGMGWLLALDAELRRWGGADAPAWVEPSVHALAPLANLCAGRLASWLETLTHPVRTGVHSQSAFAASLLLDWATSDRDAAVRARASAQARRLYAGDRAWRLSFEPSGEDFLSPGLAEADLLRRIMPGDEFAAWLAAFLPGLPAALGGFAPVRPLDAHDGRLAHLDGLSLSRAWMLRGVASALPAHDRARVALDACAATHLDSGLAGLAAGDYARTHWLGTFAMYALDTWEAGTTPPTARDTR